MDETENCNLILLQLLEIPTSIIFQGILKMIHYWLVCISTNEKGFSLLGDNIEKRSALVIQCMYST